MKVNCVLWMAESKSVVTVRRRFQSRYWKAGGNRNTIENLDEKV